MSSKKSMQAKFDYLEDLYSQMSSDYYRLTQEYGEQTSEIEQLKALCLQHNIPLPNNIDIFI